MTSGIAIILVLYFIGCGDANRVQVLLGTTEVNVAL